jgi:hypothetical protein
VSSSLLHSDLAYAAGLGDFIGPRCRPIPLRDDAQYMGPSLWPLGILLIHFPEANLPSPPDPSAFVIATVSHPRILPHRGGKTHGWLRPWSLLA